MAADGGLVEAGVLTTRGRDSRNRKINGHADYRGTLECKAAAGGPWPLEDREAGHGVQENRTGI